MGTVHIEGEVVIQRPVEDVFDFVADECNEPRFNACLVTVERITPGSIGCGTRFRAEAAGRRTPF